MDKPIDALDDILEILGLFEGVTVESHDHTSAYLHIALRLESFSSLYHLNYCAEGTNTALETYINTDDFETVRSNPALGLIHRFEVTTDDMDDEPCKRLFILGIWLVWRLYYGQSGISKKKANAFLTKWNGALIE